MSTKLSRAKQNLVITADKLGLTNGESFYAERISNQLDDLLRGQDLTSETLIRIAELVQAVTFRCFDIDPSQPHCKCVEEAKSRMPS